MTRGVDGFSNDLCDRQKAACSTCLGTLQACSKRIAHSAAATCDSCRQSMNTCFDTKSAGTQANRSLALFQNQLISLDFCDAGVRD